MKITSKDRDRFFSFVDKSNGCWTWKGGITGRFSYKHISNCRPFFWLNGKGEKGARVSYEIHNGVIPTKKHVLHRCDNHLCVNPEHLYLGTHTDNMIDRSKRGRWNGSWNRLSDDDKEDIHLKFSARKVTYAMLADEYGVHVTTIWRVLTGFSKKKYAY